MSSVETKYSIAKLDNTNYFVWKFKMKMLMVKEGTWNCIVTTAPTDTTKLEEWNRKDQQGLATIGLNVCDDQLIHIRNATTSKEAWTSLQDYHEKSTANSKVRLMKTIMRLRLEEGGDMEAHLGRINELFQQMVDLNIEMKPEDWKSATMLGSLPESYDTLITALESRKESELTSAVVQSKLIDEYKRRKDRNGIVDGEASALKVTHKHKKASNHKKKEKLCYRCGGPGHFANKCTAQVSDKENKSTVEKKVNLTTDRDDYEDTPARQEFMFAINGTKGGWFIDSGATSHITSNKALFDNLDTSFRHEVECASGKIIKIMGKGTVRIEVMNKFDKENVFEISDVYWAPTIVTDLISVDRLNDKGVGVNFTPSKRVEITLKGQQIAVGFGYGGLFLLKQVKKALITHDKTDENAESASHSGCIHEWHRILGHRDIEVVKTLSTIGHVKGVKIIPCADECKGCDENCRICFEGKITQITFPKNASRTENVLDLIHSDVCGPMNTQTPSGKRYILTLIDDCSRFTTIYLLKNKSEAFEKFKHFVEMVKTFFGKKPKVLRTDRGGEYMSIEFEEYLDAEGIQRNRTAPYTPQQNGVAERKNRTLVEMARCMLIDAKLPYTFWGEAVMTANYMQNRLPSRCIETTPYETWLGRKPVISHFRSFGSECYVRIPPERRTKLEPKGMYAILIGYDDVSKAYRCLNPKTRKVIVSRDVKFVNKNGNLRPSKPVSCNKIPKPINESNENTVVISHDSGVEREAEQITEITADLNESNLDFNDTLCPNGVSFTDSEAYFSGNDLTISDLSTIEESADDDGARRSNRSNKGVPPLRYHDQAFSMDEVLTEPLTYNEAVKGENKRKWVHAMEDEMDSLRENKTWELVNLPADRKPIGCKWVYKIKTNEKGEAKRFKARLVAQGFTQRYGFDYDEVFAPVARQKTFRILLTVASEKGMKVLHFDAKTAFLHGELKETIYMKQPPGFTEEDKEHQVCLLKRSLYGLKQSARIWNLSVHNLLIKFSYEQSKNDQCLYTKKKNDKVCHIIVYVDDILAASDSDEMLTECEQVLSSEFKIQNLGEVNTYLGIHVEKRNNMYSIDQSKYINKVLNEFGMTDAKNSDIPLSVNYGKGDESEILRDNNEYRRLIGSLLYISTNTRPDIAASVAILSQKVSNPTQEDWNEAKRILKYLKGTISIKLNLNISVDEEKLIGYCDANFAECRQTRKSNGGFIFKTFGATISWRCKKQDLIALSSMEAEYIALCDAVKEVKWLKRLLNDFGVDINNPILLYEDNQSCLKFANEEKFSDRSKHIDIKAHSVKDSIDKGIIKCVYCPTDDMVADMMTKPLPKAKIQKFREAAGLFE
jgi:transposase InsO family protein